MVAWPLASEAVANELQKNFPGYALDLIDVTDLIQARKDILITNALYTVKTYGITVLSSKARFRTYFFRTTYLFKEIKKIISNHLAKYNYRFSFQMQSLFDASLEGLPHFIYTDHTALENLNYPGFNHRPFYDKKWLKLEQKIYQNAVCSLY